MYPKIICLEGNIGAGKSTILKELEEYCEKIGISSTIRFLQEPIAEDCCELLALFYKNPKKYSFMLQVNAFISLRNSLQKLLQSCQQSPTVKYIVCERSLLSSRYIFVKLFANMDYLSPMEWKICDSLFTDDSLMKLHPDKLIYIHCKTDIAIQRIHKRSRNGECHITMDYLTHCEKEYRDGMKYGLLTKPHMNRQHENVLVVDNSNQNQNSHQRQQIYTKIIKFIHDESLESTVEHDTYIAQIMAMMGF